MAFTCYIYLVLFLQSLITVGDQKMLVPKKAPTMPKPEWHAPWKLYRVRICSCLFMEYVI